MLVDGLSGERCAVCDELRPSWMTTLTTVDDTFLAACDAGSAKLLGKYRDCKLCNRCRRPKPDEVAAGVLRFSAENNAFPKLAELLETDDPPPFADAWDAEIALVRLTIPCVQIKVLKHGGTLSKTHSVRASPARVSNSCADFVMRL